MPEMQRNAFKHAIAQGKLQIGLWSSLCSNIAAEVISDSGFDWILLDTEHSPNEIPDLVTQLQAIQRGTATPIIRPAWNDAVLAKRALDIGAQTLLFPYVQNAEEAKRAVASTRYPPQGIRGVSVAARASRYGRVPGYLTKANDEMCVLVQVETRAALDQLEAIAKVDGVDGVFIGPSDLAASLGHLGNPQHADVQSAMQDAVETSQGGRQAGRHPYRATRKRRAATSNGATCSWPWAPMWGCSRAMPTRWPRSSRRLAAAAQPPFCARSKPGSLVRLIFACQEQEGDHGAQAEPIHDIAHLGSVELFTPKPDKSLWYFRDLARHGAGPRGWTSPSICAATATTRPATLKLTAAEQCGCRLHFLAGGQSAGAGAPRQGDR